MKKRILIIAAHPDDEILGCGGTAARSAEEGNDVYALILGEGITSRDDKRDRAKRQKELNELKRQIDAADKKLGIKDTFLHDLPDNRFDTIPFLDIVKIVERTKNEIKPGIIFTHYKEDLNIDHRITYKAALTATRPTPDEAVKEIYSFEILSSTEWNFPMSFSPDCFFDIADTLDLKLQAMSEYKTELRDFPHPRSLQGVKLSAEYWGMHAGVKYAEAFKAIRLIR